jgi:hypothetical protein
MSQKIKNIIFVLLLALLSLPALQHATKIVSIKPLDGDYVLTRRPYFSWSSWMDVTYQLRFDRYIEDHIGFRPFFVRLSNQIDFSLFDKANAEGIVLGKNKMVYEYDYIREMVGEDFIGQRTLDKKLQRMKFLQRFLKDSLNIDFVLMLEPGKARIYPEHVPDRFFDDSTSLTNYEYIRDKARELDINLLDLNAHFIQVKDTITYPLYPRYGIHWSEHTMTFVADTLIRFLEKLRNISMPDFTVERIILSDSLAASDYDGALAMNLLWRLPHQKMPYPVFSFHHHEERDRPMVLAVGDSYYWNFYNTRIPKNLFANQAFWYFNAQVYPETYDHETWTRELDLKKEIEKQDIIILGVTGRFLYKVDWNFIDQVYALYTPEYTGDIVYKYENQLRINSGWFDEVVTKAQQQKQTLEEAIRKEAYYQAWTKEPETFLLWYGQEHFKSVISSDAGWVASVREKAQQNDISYEEQLNKDADYIFETEYPLIYKRHQLIRMYQNAIRSDSAWRAKVAEKADYYNMPVEEMIKVDAEYLANQQKIELPEKTERIEYFENLIRSDTDWLEMVTQKAREQGKPLDQMIREDAIYMVEQEKKK